MQSNSGIRRGGVTLWEVGVEAKRSPQNDVPPAFSLPSRNSPKGARDTTLRHPAREGLEGCTPRRRFSGWVDMGCLWQSLRCRSERSFLFSNRETGGCASKVSLRPQAPISHFEILSRPGAVLPRIRFAPAIQPMPRSRQARAF
jgi:hypothetical protein